MELCDYLKKLRKVYGMTQNVLSEMLGIKRSTYSAYETGRITPTLATIQGLADIYQIPIKQFMQEIEYNGNSIEKHEESENEYRMEQELLHYFYRCNRQKRELICKYMNYLQNAGC